MQISNRDGDKEEKRRTAALSNLFKMISELKIIYILEGQKVKKKIKVELIKIPA